MEDLKVSFTIVLVQLNYYHHNDVAHVITVFGVDKNVTLTVLLVAAILKLWPDGQLYSNTECEETVQLHESDRIIPTPTPQKRLLHRNQ